MKLLVADDERDIADAIREVLERNKLPADVVYNGDDACACLLTGSYDGAILDILMPGMDGLAVVKKLRQHHVDTPVLLLTALGELDDRVQGLEAGADDYLAKPFAMRELVARVRALLRRSGSSFSEVLSAGNLRLDCSTYEMSCGGRSLRVSGKEYQILECLLRNPRQVVTTESLLQKCWGWDAGTDQQVVWTNITNLRRKLSLLGADVEIRSVRGVGYQVEVREC